MIRADTHRVVVTERAGDPRTEPLFQSDTFRDRLQSGYYSRRIEAGAAGIAAIVGLLWLLS